jgi:hypothetical protein
MWMGANGKSADVEKGKIFSALFTLDFVKVDQN